MAISFIRPFPISFGEDSTVRSIISRITRLNKRVFSTLLIPAGNTEEYCINVDTPGTWATQDEVVATATIFRIPVYFCTINSHSINNCRLYVIHSLSESQWAKGYSMLLDLDKSNPLMRPDHYYEDCHYNVVVFHQPYLVITVNQLTY